MQLVACTGHLHIDDRIASKAFHRSIKIVVIKYGIFVLQRKC